jgi:hypothetical protein
VALIATHAKKPVFEATAFEIRFKLSMDMSRQTFALKFQLLNQGRVVFLYKLVEQSLLWAMAIIGGVTKGMPINRGRPSLAW